MYLPWMVFNTSLKTLLILSLLIQTRHRHLEMMKVVNLNRKKRMKEGIELEAPKEEKETLEPDRMTIPILFF